MYTRGLHNLGNAVYAYLQPDGSWGWSNAGIIADSGVSLLADTLYDLRLTHEVLATMKRSIPEAEQIDMLVNTHAIGDHCYGNQLVGEARIIASRRTAEEMLESPPELMAALLRQAPDLGAFGAFVNRIFRSFDFTNTTFWLNAERLVVNVAAIYRELGVGQDEDASSTAVLLGLMAISSSNSA
jgi:cyclase